MKYFDYLEPTTLSEASLLLAEYGKDARALAGGTDLLVRMKRQALAPRYLINLKRIPGLASIEANDSTLRIGALATIRAVHTSPAVRQQWAVIGEAAQKMASVQVRNLATIGGNLCNAAPSADMAPALIGLGAQARIVSSSGERIISLEEFFVGPGATALGQGELLAELIVPAPPSNTGAIYVKHAIRKAMDIAMVGVAIVLTLDSSGKRLNEVRVVLGAVAPTPMRARKTEDVLRGKAVPLDDAVLSEAAEAATAEARPISDVRASEYYRRKLVGVLVKRAAIQALERASEGRVVAN
ncbi:MAG: xanthine dehydrogenase family protein subunit M [Chloroflexi bacterium]|nr:xanthine dehydrogenase family protein subunit M [Chloroflexota bacterium]MDA8187432.1 xanthine dehydrogenase family protein subunit M [Dehalococcoidales bacterium]